jgi:hypothetical protein
MRMAGLAPVAGPRSLQHSPPAPSEREAPWLGQSRVQSVERAHRFAGSLLQLARGPMKAEAQRGVVKIVQVACDLAARRLAQGCRDFLAVTMMLFGVRSLERVDRRHLRLIKPRSRAGCQRGQTFGSLRLLCAAYAAGPRGEAAQPPSKRAGEAFCSAFVVVLARCRTTHDQHELVNALSGASR